MDTTEITKSIEHVVSVVTRWWLLIAISSILAVSLGAVASAGSGTHYVATTRVVVVQPAQLLAVGEPAATSRLADLMNTVALLGTSDAVLEQARQKAAPDTEMDTMRRRVQVAVIPQSLGIVIRTDFPKEQEAAEVGAAVASALSSRLGTFSNSAADPSTLLTLEPVQSPVVQKVAPSVLRTLLVSLILGFGLSVLAAFALDRS